MIPSRRRWPYLVASLVVVLAVGAVVVWRVWLPTWRPSLERGQSYGVDVSNHQGVIDWRAVEAADIDFAYLKASEGRDFTDRRFAENWRSISRTTMDRGAYHYFTRCSSGVDQARHFLSVAPPDPQAMPPAVDLEALTGACAPSPAKVVREVDDFVQMVEREWHRPIVLYVSTDFDEAYPAIDRLRRPLWRPHLFGHPSAEDWLLWQASSSARVDGIAGDVDLDVRAAQ